MARGHFDERDFWRRRPPWMDKWAAWAVIGAIVAIYLLTGIYTVGPYEEGLVKQFGRYIATAGPGIHYHLPAPMESVVTVNLLKVRKEEIGFRTISPPPAPRYREVEEEALMLTGDGNIVFAEVVVQYRVKDPKKVAFNLIDPEVIVKQAAEAVLREKVATRTIDETLTTERDVIATEAHQSLQELLDSYGAGIVIVNVQLQDVKPPKAVIAAFDDVNSARQDKDKLINQAQKYEMDILPKARGDAQEIINQAEAYKQERIKRAEGDVARFIEVLKKYQLGEDVTRTRLYIETMEEILPGMNKIILTQGASGVFQLLDLEKLISGGEQ